MSRGIHRQALAGAVDAEPDLSVVGEADDLKTAAAEAGCVEPDVIIVEAGLIAGDDHRKLSGLREPAPDAAMLVIGPEREDELVAALEAGAAGYLGTSCTLTELLAGIRAVRAGEVVAPGTMVRSALMGLVRGRRERDDARERLSRLTRREREVLSLLVRLGETAAIAEALVISPQTARTHIQNVLAKLGVHSRVQAVAFVLESGVSFDVPALAADPSARRVPAVVARRSA